MTRRLPLVGIVVIAVAAAGAAILIGSPGPRTLVGEAAFPSAMAALPDGGLLYAERETGRIRSWRPDRGLDPAPVASVEVSRDGQRGLLGIAVDERGRVYASWTDTERRLVVARVAPGERRVVWTGPLTAERGNGGRILFSPNQRLLIGIGDLEDPSKVADPQAPNGKILALDIQGRGEPEVVSTGWNNPFAFDVTEDGDLWVADNAPGRRPERLARASLQGPVLVTELPATTAPSGLAALRDGDLLVCGYVSRTLVRYTVGPDGFARRVGEPLAGDCSLDVVQMSDGRVAYANEQRISVLRVS